MARGVDDVDFIILVNYRDVLREDRDTAFAFEVVVVEDQLAGLLGVVAQDVAGQDHLVYERGLAVIHVCNNCNIA